MSFVFIVNTLALFDHCNGIQADVLWRFDTNREHVKIVVSPSGKYFRIRDDCFKYNNQNGYFDILGDRGKRLRGKIKREYSGGTEHDDIDGIIKERTHFRL